MTAYGVAEIFATIQGEATWTGTPSIFLRLMGCPVGCSWCDTRPTWDALDENQVGAIETGPRIHTFDPKARTMTWASLEADALAQQARAAGPARHAVVTGGEPLMQPPGALARALAAQGFETVQFETSGTAPLGDLPGWAKGIWVTLSPKVGMPGGRVVLPEVVRRADEIKWPVGKSADVAKLRAFLAEHEVSETVPVWLQPLSQNVKSTALCVKTALADGRMRVSIQTHKYLGVA